VNLHKNSKTASIIIPTYNRRTLLENTLQSLCSQGFPPQDFEVIVVVDGCTDDTAKLVSGFESPFHLSLIEQPRSGAAVARNQGAKVATGKVLIFLDDDITTHPRFVEAHVLAHQNNPNLVLIGYLPPLIPERRGYFSAELRIWWAAMFEKMRLPDYRFKYTDLVGGNFSLSASLFAEVGMFNPGFRCHEDYELGVRLLQTGATFAFSMEAYGSHHETTDLECSLKRKYDEGIADVRIGSLYPQLRSALPISRLDRFAFLPASFLQLLVFSLPYAGDLIAAALLRLMTFFDQAHLYFMWLRVLNSLLVYWYWRGVAEELTTPNALKQFTLSVQSDQCDQVSTLEVDLAKGLAEVERLMDLHQPDRLKILYNGKSVGCMPCAPGAEKLKSVHLRPFLAAQLVAPLMRVMALDDTLTFQGVRSPMLAFSNHMIAGGSDAELGL
jgi:glycosyltransferase involved in cell wall biosynthesis